MRDDKKRLRDSLLKHLTSLNDSSMDGPNSASFLRWQRSTLATIEKLFRTDSEQYLEFAHLIQMILNRRYEDPATVAPDFQSLLEQSGNLLETMISEFEDESSNEVAIPPSQSTAAIRLRIFLCYRRSDVMGLIGRIYDRLQGKFGREHVFMDIDRIPYGVDFRHYLNEALANTDVLLPVIGAQWLQVQADGTRRIDDPNDLVRKEIELSLERGISIIPVLVGNAKMPDPGELPETLTELAYRNAIRVDPGIDFHHHMDRLIRCLENFAIQPNVD